MSQHQDATASQPVTKNLPPEHWQSAVDRLVDVKNPPQGQPMRKDEIIRRLRDLGETGHGRITWAEREAILAAVYKLEMQP